MIRARSGFLRPLSPSGPLSRGGVTKPEPGDGAGLASGAKAAGTPAAAATAPLGSTSAVNGLKSDSKAPMAQSLPKASATVPSGAPPAKNIPPSTFRAETLAQLDAMNRGWNVHSTQAPADLLRAVQSDSTLTDALDLLAARGVLNQKDSKGTSVADHLRDILKRPEKPGLPSPTQVVRELIDGWVSPQSIHQGNGTFSCTAATIQGIMASTSPGEYARVVKGLVFDGQVQTAGGDKLEANLSGLAQDEGRNGVEDIFQETVMSFGRGLPEVGSDKTWGNGSFGSVTPASRPKTSSPPAVGSSNGSPKKPRGRLGSLVAGNDGLTSHQFSETVRSLTGQRSVTLEPAEGFTKASMQGVLSELLKKGPVPVGVSGVDSQGNPTLHAVRVTSLTPGTITFQDSGKGKSETVPADEFQRSLRLVVVPFDKFADLENGGLGSAMKLPPSGGGGGLRDRGRPTQLH